MIMVELNKSDYQAAQALHYRSSHQHLGFLAVISGLLLGLVAFIVYSPQAPTELRLLSRILALLVMLGWTVIALDRWLLTPLRASIAYRRERLQPRQRVYSWSAAGLHAEDEQGSTTILWEDFLRTSEDKRSFMLYLSKDRFMCIPRRAFANKDDASAFGRLIQAKIDARAR
jgi:hypothetical protein